MNFYDKVLLEGDISAFSEALEEKAITDAIETLESYGIPMLEATISLLETYGILTEGSVSYTDMDHIDRIEQIERDMSRKVAEVKKTRREDMAIKVINSIISVAAGGAAVGSAVGKVTGNDTASAVGGLASLITVPLAVITGVKRHKAKKAENVQVDKTCDWFDHKIAELEGNIEDDIGNVPLQKVILSKLKAGRAKVEKDTTFETVKNIAGLAGKGIGKAGMAAGKGIGKAGMAAGKGIGKAGSAAIQAAKDRSSSRSASSNSSSSSSSSTQSTRLLSYS